VRRQAAADESGDWSPHSKVMRIVFMGTPAAAVPSLQRCLEDGHEIVAVWTRSDRPSGRGNKIAAPAVKEFALAHHLAVHQPKKIRTDEATALFASHDADVAVVVAYGRILPLEILCAPRRGCLNVHFSLLPQYRGAAPVNWAIVNGETMTGVTTMFIEEQLDAGPILLQRETEVGATETAPELMSRLAPMGADLLSETLARLGTLTPRPQHDRDATYAPMMQKDDGRIRWADDALAIERLVRGFQPWPNAYTHEAGRRLIIWRAAVEKRDDNLDPASGPGAVIAAHGDDLVVKCGAATALRLLEVQPEGKRRMTVRDFLNGTHLRVGEELG
jgi:methionyl-tRNA formyltransferase